MSETQPLRKYTPDELAQGDGREGRPALVGYKGKVYDCTPSKLWRNGKHVNAHHAGHDLTAEMAAAPHADDVMGRYPVVGLLVQASAEGPAVRETPAAVSLLLAQHPHPITVHAPVAMGSFAALLILLHLVTGGGPALMGQSIAPTHALSCIFESVAFWLTLLTAVTAPVGTATGLLSWWFNYQGLMTPLYRQKIIYSIVLSLVSITAVWIRLAAVRGITDPQPASIDGPLYVLYALLVGLQAPVVIWLGRLGGKIVYGE